jgi:2-haloacid dehalogenase
LASLWPDADAERLLERYHEIEPRVQQGSALSYRDVLAQALGLLAGEEGLALAPGDEAALAESLPSWRPFPEVPGALANLRGRGFNLVILSNTDPDLLAASLERIGVPVEGAITAAEAGSYKPAHGHWHRFFEQFQANREHHLHVGASVFHDLEPAAELGLRAVWINRLREASDAPRAAELKDLSRLPEVADSLVPAEPGS